MTDSCTGITERKKAKEALHESEERFRTIFHAMQFGIVIIDAQTHTILEANHKFIEMIGGSNAPVSGSVCHLFICPAELGSCPFTDPGQTVDSSERILLTMRGEQIPILKNVVKTMLGGKEVLIESFFDIPERKKVEEALRESEERYRNIIEEQTELICRFLPDGTHLFVNDAYCRYFDTKRELIIGQRFGPVIHPDDREMVARHFASLTPQSPVMNVDQRTITPDGRIRWQRWSDRAIFNQENRVIEYQSVGRDITEQKRAEEAQVILLQDLAMKNTELERFTYTVSHDLKSPLITIKGFLGILEKDMKSGDADRMHKDIARIHAATGKMENFIAALLELSRIGRIANPPLNVLLAPVVREAAEMLDTQIRERGVTLVIPDETLMVYCDRVRLLQVFSNLLENAVKFMGDQKEPRIEITLRHNNGEDTICVRDNGMGIAPGHMARIFTIFERLNPGIAGSGIGLALVKRIVEVHGGKCWVESEGLGKGSTFCFTLPEAPPPEEKE